MTIPSIDINTAIQNTCLRGAPSNNEQIIPIFWRLISNLQETLSTASERSLRDVYDVAIQNRTSSQANKICLLYEILQDKALAQTLADLSPSEQTSVIECTLSLLLPEVGPKEKLHI